MIFFKVVHLKETGGFTLRVAYLKGKEPFSLRVAHLKGNKFFSFRVALERKRIIFFKSSPHERK